uniref:Uncharacterized protein n=1 Tax=Oryctolagus cuniculus TaxID=9986 RepID=A0A5F9DGA3_RABIT
MKNWQEGNHLFSVCSYVTLNKVFFLKGLFISFLTTFCSGSRMPCFLISQSFFLSYPFVSASYFLYHSHFSSAYLENLKYTGP